MFLAFALSCAGVASAEGSDSSGASIIRLQRDTQYEQTIRYAASVDKTITPTRVLRWVNSLMGNTSTTAPSAFEFQPIVRTHDNRQQFIAQIAYKF